MNLNFRKKSGRSERLRAVMHCKEVAKKISLGVRQKNIAFYKSRT